MWQYILKYVQRRNSGLAWVGAGLFALSIGSGIYAGLKEHPSSCIIFSGALSFVVTSVLCLLGWLVLAYERTASSHESLFPVLIRTAGVFPFIIATIALPTLLIVLSLYLIEAAADGCPAL